MTSDTTTFPLTRPINLLIRFGHGSVRVEARDGIAEAVVRLTPRNGQSHLLDRIKVEMQGQTLVVSAPRQGGLADLIGGWRRDRDSIDAVLVVPTGTPVKIVAASEDVTIVGCCGETDIAASAARISVDTVAGDLRLRYGRADSRVGRVTGTAEISSGTGSAHFGEVEGRLKCQFGSGDLVVGVARGGLQSRAGSASARVDAVYGDTDIAFGSGPISIGLPAGVPAEVDITSGTGPVRSDLPLDQAPAAGVKPITIRARTGRGEVEIVRSAA